jgi:hypothetical protein
LRILAKGIESKINVMYERTLGKLFFAAQGSTRSTKLRQRQSMAVMTSAFHAFEMASRWTASYPVTKG